MRVPLFIERVKEANVLKWKRSFQLASVYVGTVVGAGFATGKEIVEFFSQYGAFGLLGIWIAGLLFIWFGIKIMLLAIRLKAKSFHQLNMYMFGPYITPIINVMMFVMLIGVSAVMLSGAGSVFEEQLHLPKQLGVLFTVFLTLLVLTIGTNGLVLVNSFVVPLLIFFSFMLASLSFQLDDFWTNIIHKEPFSFEVITSGFAYASFNISLATAVLVPAASEIGDEKVVKWGGILGGAALTIILIASHVTLVQLPGFTSFHIPMAVMMETLAPTFYFIYILIIYGEIFTSVIGNVYGLERFIRKGTQGSTLIVSTCILAVSYSISLIDYSTLLATLYPMFGYVSLAFLLILVFK
jgi:uncharacterized membrane protein YkvI